MNVARRFHVLLAAAASLAFAAGAASAESFYRVRPGDSLSSIAVAHGTTVPALASLNRLDPERTLFAGSTLKVPETALQPYLVQPGDTLTAIAGRFSTTPTALARANGLVITHVLFAGITLKVPAVSEPTQARYTVQPGDTLTAIAVRYGVALGGLAALNGLRLSDVLFAGRQLVLPAGAAPPSSGDGTVRGSLLFWSGHYGVNASLASALAWMESGFNNAMVSSAGAVGVMQITPATWDYVETVLLGRTVPHTTDGNVRVGVALLHHLLNLYGSDERKALAAYYQGPRALDEFGFLPGTAEYVENVLALKRRF